MEMSSGDSFATDRRGSSIQIPHQLFSSETLEIMGFEDRAADIIYMQWCVQPLRYEDVGAEENFLSFALKFVKNSPSDNFGITPRLRDIIRRAARRSGYCSKLLLQHELATRFEEIVEAFEAIENIPVCSVPACESYFILPMQPDGTRHL